MSQRNGSGRMVLTMAYHHGHLREALVEAGLALISAEGVGALSMRAVAAKVGVTHAAPYAHFRDKKELIQAICARGFDLLTAAMESNSNAASGQDRIVRFGVAYVLFAVRHAALYRLMFAAPFQTSEDDTAAPSITLQRLRAASDRAIALVKTLYDGAEAASRPARGKALSAWAQAHGLASLLIEGVVDAPEGVSIEDFVAATLESSAPPMD